MQALNPQVSTVADADRVEKLGVKRIVGLGLVLIWLAVLVTTIVLRRRIDYATHEPLLYARARPWALMRSSTSKRGGGTLGAGCPASDIVVEFRLHVCQKESVLKCRKRYCSYLCIRVPVALLDLG